MDYPKMSLGHIKSSMSDSIEKIDEPLAMSSRPRVRRPAPLVVWIIRRILSSASEPLQILANHR